MSLLHLLNLFGVAVFAVSGVLAAGRKSLDLFGVLVIAIVTAIGGGTLRDVMLNRHPIFWFREDEHLIVIVAAALLTSLYLRYWKPPRRSLVVADALGLAVFTISGTQIALATGHSTVIAIIMGVMTGVAGGVIRDILTNEIPLIFRRGDLYATAAIAGATFYVLLILAGLPRPVPTVSAIIAIFLLRLASIFWGLKLPTLRLHEPARSN